MPPEVAVLLVAYNGEADLETALAAVAAQGAPCEIHVWDNASRDRTCEIAARHAEVVLHRSESNVGFCAANNRLLALTDAPYVLFLNPDARLLPGCLARLLETLASAPADVAGVAPKMLKPATAGEPRRIDSAGIVLARRRLAPHDRGEGEIDGGQYDAPGEIFGPSFACALWRREAIADVSLAGQFLDEEFFAYYEDVDVAWRARRLGRRFLYEPRAVCEHRRNLPARGGPALAARAFVNRWLLLLANEDGARGWTYLLCLVPRETARLLWKSLTVRGFAVAWRMAAAGWRGAWRKRRQIAARVKARP
jgi:GT2 family glycosyltransferase